MNIYNLSNLQKSGLSDIEIFETIESTNTYAKELLLADSPRPTPFGIIADHQSKGRGRYTKSFYSPAGTGIYMTYVYRKQYTEEELLGVTTEVANIISPVFEKHCPSGTLWIKPINDIFRDNKKFVGILVERVDNPKVRGDYALVVGIGINCYETEVPDELKSIVGFLEPDCTREELATELFDVLHEHLNK